MRRRLPLVLLAAVTIASASLPAPAAAQLFENVRTSTDEPVQVGVLLVGEKYHIDREYTVTSLPDFLVGAAFIKTANDDKTNTEDEHLFFDLTEEASLFVAYDARESVLPAWLENFQFTEQQVGTTDAGTDLDLYVAENIPAGPYSLGGNRAAPNTSANTNYIVIAVTGEGGGGGIPASFFADDLTGRVPHTVFFDATASTETGANITSYEWDFGDGTTGTGQTVEHTYTAPGAYRIVLTVEDDQGNTATNSDFVAYAGSTVGTVEDPLRIARVDDAPAIDGDVDASYETAQSTRVFHNNVGAIDLEGDLGADARLTWDDDNLYILLEVLDDALLPSDEVRVFIDGNNDKSPSDDENDLNLTGLRADAALVTNLPEGVEYMTALTDIGYNIEMSVPWTVMGVSPSVDHQIGFEVRMIDQDDEKEERLPEMAWFVFEGGGRNPSLYGTAQLLAGSAVAAEDPAELPASFAIEGIYPNPFNPATTVAVQMREAGTYAVTVHNVLGQRVHTQEIGAVVPGRIEIPINFDGQPSGIYLVTIENKMTGAVVTANAILLK